MNNGLTAVRKAFVDQISVDRLVENVMKAGHFPVDDNRLPGLFAPGRLIPRDIEL